MLKSAKTRLWFLAILGCFLACAAPQLKSSSVNAPLTEPYPSSAFNPDNFKTRAVFELVNHQPGLIQQGSNKISTESALVTHTNGLMGNTEGLEIQFFTRLITEADQKDVLENGAKEMKGSDYAALVLFLDKQNKIGQVNLSYVVPGTTVARTVAWKPEDLKKYFSDYQFDGKRLQLKSKGTYSETDSEQRTMSLAWDVNIDLPVFDRRKK
ncbi:MAG TPA: hypothetical protein VGJ48_17215 [Pyrinomonadaceae bacterium]|jgi:hypothetical protein